MAKIDLRKKIGKEGGTLPSSLGKNTSRTTGSQTVKENAGTYFKLPEDFGSRTEELEGAVATAQSGLQKQNTVLKATQDKVQQIQNAILMAENGNLPMLNLQNMKKDLQVAQTTLIIEQDKANKAYEGYNSAVASYNDYVGQQKATYDQWRGTIREESQIEKELAEVDAQLRKLKGKNALAAAGDFVANVVSGFSATSSGLAPTTMKHSGNENEVQIQELEEKKALLQEERKYSIQFRDAELAQQQEEMKKTADVSAMEQELAQM